MMSELDPCEFLDWDTSFFGHRIARMVAHRLFTESIEQTLLWCKANQIECLYFLADADHSETIQHAEARGFCFVDIRVALRHDFTKHPGEQPDALPKDVMTRPFQDSDIPGLQGIARTNHRDSRFYFDPHFPVEACDALYKTWIQRSCAGYADAVFVADVAGHPSGYISCHLPGKEPYGQIGLLGVSPSTRGQGIGQSLVRQALDWFTDHNVDLVQVVTQGRNTAAQRLYQRCGFLTHQVQIWYHKWMPPYF